MTEPLVALDNVTKRFASGTLALENFALAVGERQFISLVGPSGCGKSTVLRLIAGLTQPSAGRIRRQNGIKQNGAKRNDTGDLAGEQLGFVFQEPTLMPWARVLDNVLLPLKLRGTDPIAARKRAREALAMVGLDGVERAFPRELSGGMKMRVSIARALVMRPKLLLMDEPFAALDEITRLKLNDDLLALWAGQDWTVIFVTHSVYESVYLSNRIIVMAARPGRVAAEIDVAAPYPRSAAFRHAPDYAETCRLVSGALAGAMAA
jgi:NitT/TauT family transport system ATP-binding protein